MINVYCVSDNNTDIYKTYDTAYPGGSGPNAAVNIVRTGNKAAFCGYVGKDMLGQKTIDALREEGVDVSNIKKSAYNNDWCFIYHDNGDRKFGKNVMPVRENCHFNAEDIKAGQNGEYDLIYTCAEATYDDDGWAQLGKSDIPVACDFSNYSPEDPRGQVLYRSKGIVDYFYISMDGRPETSDEMAEKCLKEYGAKLVICTNGSAGSDLYNGRKKYHQDAYLVDAIDTLGAGDTYLSSFTSCYFSGLKLLKQCAAQIGWDENNEHYQACEDKLIEESLAFAAVCSAKNCMIKGGFGHGFHFEESMISE